MKPNTFVTEDGREYPICSISLLDLKQAELGVEEEYRKRGEPIDPPTYDVEIAGGGKITKPLTEELLEASDPAETERRKSAWASHIAALINMRQEIGQVTQEIILDGLNIQLPADDDWIKRRERRHIHIPPEIVADKYLLLLYYKKNEILKTPGDIVRFQQEVILLSSSGTVDRKAVEAAGASFLGSIQGIAASEGNTAN